MSSGVEGLDGILANLNKEIRDLPNRTMAGLYEAGLQVQRAAQKELKASVVTGNLRASAYTRSADKFTRLDPEQINADAVYPDPSDRLAPTRVEIGFTALYAVYAHENMNGRAPKFLEGPILRNQKAILEIIKQRAKMHG